MVAVIISHLLGLIGAAATSSGTSGSLDTIGKGLVYGLAAIGPGIGIGLIEALALFGLMLSFII